MPEERAKRRKHKCCWVVTVAGSRYRPELLQLQAQLHVLVLQFFQQGILGQ